MDFAVILHLSKEFQQMIDEEYFKKYFDFSFLLTKKAKSYAEAAREFSGVSEMHLINQ